MIIAADGDVIRAEHVPAELGRARPGRSAEASAEMPTSFHALREEAERRIVVQALERHEWHITRTAEALGLADHASLLKIMRRLGIRRPDGG
jgi:DNA-binding NtrC family response regulator